VNIADLPQADPPSTVSYLTAANKILKAQNDRTWAAVVCMAWHRNRSIDGIDLNWYCYIVPTVLKSGTLNLIEHSGPVKACNGIVFYIYDG
jgi:hypothetical protein